MCSGDTNVYTDADTNAIRIQSQISDTESEEKNMPGTARRKAGIIDVNYVHNYEFVGEFFRCKFCGWEISDANDKNLRNDPCPERIVQEVVSRLSAELEKANVIPAKRRHQDR